MRLLAILIITLAFVNVLLFYIYWVSETNQSTVGSKLSRDDVYNVYFSYDSELYDLSEYQAKGIAVLGVTLSGLAVLFSVIYLRSNRKLDREIAKLEKQLRIDELKKKLKEMQ